MDSSQSTKRKMMYTLQSRNIWQDGDGIWTVVDYPLIVEKGSDDSWAMDALISWLDHEKNKEPKVDPYNIDAGLIRIEYKIVIAEIADEVLL